MNKKRYVYFLMMQKSFKGMSYNLMHEKRGNEKTETFQLFI